MILCFILHDNGACRIWIILLGLSTMWLICGHVSLVSHWYIERCDEDSDPCCRSRRAFYWNAYV